MPVKFEGQSEYQRRFDGGNPDDPPLPAFYKRPQDDPKSQQTNDGPTGVTHEPAIQHKKPVMSHGVPQEAHSHSYAVLEPPIQRKKKPIVPHGSLTEQEVTNGAEYVLLGSQEKFTPNIIYKAKATPARMEQEIMEEVVETPAAPRQSHSKAPKVHVDTGAPQNINKGSKDAKSNGHVQSVSHVQRPHKPDRTSKKQQQESSNQKAAPSTKKSAQNGASPQKSLPKPIISKSEPKGHSVQKEVQVQANGIDTQQGAAPADQQAPADYALKYKAGIAPHRTRGPKRLSEYQLQFSWKKGVGASPLLDAEQVVYKSSTQLVPPPKGFSQMSEYRKQYQSWDAAAQQAAEGEVIKQANTNKARMRRSKSVEAVSPDRREPAGSQRMTASHDPRLVQQSLNPQRLHFPHGPQKREKSEYAMSYASPSNFQYEEGAWKGSVQKANNSQGDDKAAPPCSESSWFAEVVELRNKADEYRKRARGTHFSRQHVAQLLAQQTELWDTASTSSILSALSLEHPISERSVVIAKPVVHQSRSRERPPAGKKTAWGHDRDPPTARDDGSLFSGARSISAASVSDRQSEISETLTLVDEQDDFSVGLQTPMSPEGRLPTPVLPDGKRHHLDRTTPLVGGALLSSPPHAKKVQGKRHLKHPRSVDSTNSGPASGSRSAVSEPVAAPVVSHSSQTSKSVSALVKPTYGMPTRDAHFLLDDEASTDRPLNTNFVNSPPRQQKGGHHNRDRFPDVDVPATIQEASGATYKSNSAKVASRRRTDRNPGEVLLSDIPPRPDLEDDVLSISARSVASSCSMASEVLDRARQRRDNFWEQKRGISGKA